MRSLLMVALVACAGMFAAPLASADPGPNPPNESVILPMAVADIANQLDGKQARLQIKTERTSGPWVFLWALMKEPNGEPLDYSGTPKEAAAQHGAASGNYVALFRRDAVGAWHLVVSRVGPTDLAWGDWDQRYGAPSELFAGTTGTR